MKAMKKVIVIGGLILAGATGANAQQMGQFSQYVQNPFILNPAAAGIYNYTDINLSMRNQWTGLDNAPATYYLSVNARLKKKTNTPMYAPSLRTSIPDDGNVAMPEPNSKFRHGIGGFLVSDEYGAFRKLSGNLSYAFHMPLGQAKKYYLSIGAGLGVSNTAFDQTMVQLTDPLDNTYNNFIAAGTSDTYLDVNAGLWLYSDNLFVGYTSNQLLGDKVSFGDGLNSPELQIHHFATIGYKIQAGDNFTVTPSGMFKLMSPSPASFDATLRAEWKELVWIGASYRHTDAIAGLVGFNIANNFRVGYSYDYTLSNLSTYNSGGHEIVLGLMLGK